MTREKYPIAGTTLPIALDAADPNRLEIAWGEVPTVDEWIAAGHEVFTDPDAARARARDAFAAAGGPAQPPPAPAAVEVPCARVIAVSPGTSMSSRSAWNVDMLLSVQLPGEPRYGMRWKGKIDKRRDLSPWSDIPIRAEASKPGKVDIPWDQLPDAPPGVPRHQISLGTYDLRA
jgi:hypothetical protein